MANNSIIRTFDVVEVKDTKVLTSAPHAPLSVAAGEDYNSVTTKIVNRLPTADQKLALDNTLSLPSAANPVVLKDDIETYIPALDLGEVKDSVQTYGDLPLVGNTLGDLRAVIDDNIIYRWNGVAWTQFIRSGTFDHTELSNQNDDPAYQHLTTADLTTLNTQTHVHTNLGVLNAITDIGSGQIITTPERNRIPSSDVVDALKGTYGVPSNTNRYVTHQDPRLNTIRNPYVTVGPPASLATYTGVDMIPFDQAIFALHSGSATAVKAIEVLPGTYTFGAGPLTWSNAAPLLIEAMTPGSVTIDVGVAGILATGAGGPLTLRGINFIVHDYSTYALSTTRDYSTFEDCTFNGTPLDNTQIGLLLNAAKCLVRRCVFSGVLLEGVRISGNDCIVEDCEFNLDTATRAGVHVMPTASNAKVVRSKFASGVVFTEGSYTEVLDNYLTSYVKDFATGTRALGNVPGQYNQSYLGVIKTIGPLNSHADYRSDDETGFTQAFSDAGASAKYSCTITVASPAVVTTPVNLFANGERVFFTKTPTGALPTGLVENTMYYVKNKSGNTFQVASTASGPSITTTLAGSGTFYVHSGVTHFEVLPGTYTFTSTVTVPVGCRLKGVGATVNSSVTAFALENFAGLEGISLVGDNAAGLVASSGTSIEVMKCSFTTTANHGLVLTNCTDSVVRGCLFGGFNGYKASGLTRGVVEDSTFTCTNDNMRLENGSNVQVRDNYFVSTPMPQIGALPPLLTDSIVEGNHFLGTLPTKINTTGTIWQSNYPEDANNIDGVDFIEIDLMGYLEPITSLCTLSTIASTGSIEFDAVNKSSAVTPLIDLKAKVRTDEPFYVDLYWSSTGASGVVKWEVVSVFKNKSTDVLLSAFSVADVDTRTGATSDIVDSLLDLTQSSYGAASVDAVSITVSRLGADPFDTMIQAAHLVGARLRIPRD